MLNLLKSLGIYRRCIRSYARAVLNQLVVHALTNFYVECHAGRAPRRKSRQYNKVKYIFNADPSDKKKNGKSLIQIVYTFVFFCTLAIRTRGERSLKVPERGNGADTMSGVYMREELVSPSFPPSSLHSMIKIINRHIGERGVLCIQHHKAFPVPASPRAARYESPRVSDGLFSLSVSSLEGVPGWRNKQD